MDLSDLPASALKLIAEAEIEAKYILRESGTSALFSIRAPKADGEQPDSEPDEFSEGRNRAARHLFGVTATHLWKRVQPDLDAFKVRLNGAKKWVDGKFHPDAGVLNDAAAFERRWARREVGAKRSVSEQPRILPRGALGAAMIRRRQALKEGRLDGYVGLPSAVQAFAPPFPGGLPGANSPARKGGRPVMLVDGERIKELRGEFTQAVFARLCRVSVDAVQRAERHGRSSEKTIRKIVSRLRRQGQKIEKKDLMKNTPQ